VELRLKMAEEGLEKEIRQAAREEKLRKKKQRMKQHGKGLGKIYRDTVEKRGK
jgi:hypothetical protein